MGSLKLLSEVCHQTFGRNFSHAFNFPFLNYKPCMVQYVSSGKTSSRSRFLQHIKNIVPRCDKSCEAVKSFTGEGDWTKLLNFYCNLSAMLWCSEPCRRALALALLLFGPCDYYSRRRTVPENNFLLLFQLPGCPFHCPEVVTAPM